MAEELKLSAEDRIREIERCSTIDAKLDELWAEQLAQSRDVCAIIREVDANKGSPNPIYQQDGRYERQQALNQIIQCLPSAVVRQVLAADLEVNDDPERAGKVTRDIVEGIAIGCAAMVIQMQQTADVRRDGASVNLARAFVELFADGYHTLSSPETLQFSTPKQPEPVA